MPAGSPAVAKGSTETVRLTAVIRLDKASRDVAAAVDVEHATGIYSGIVRMLDLALGVEEAVARNSSLVAPDDREDDVRARSARPAFSRAAELAFPIASTGRATVPP